MALWLREFHGVQGARPFDSGLGHFVIVVVVIAALLADSSKPLGNRLGSSAIASLLIPFLWCMVLRPRMTIDSEQITVVGPVSTTVIPLRDVVRADGRRRLYIERSTGPPVGVWAVQSSNLALWFGDGRAVDVAAEVDDIIRQSR